MESTELEIALNKAYEAYLTFGARSPEKIYPLHRQVAAQIEKTLSRLGDVYAARMNDPAKSGEVKVPGAFYDKNIDITVVKGKTRKSGKSQIKLEVGAAVEFCIGVKFVTSNFKQNINNYFEGMVGETANIQATGIPYGQLIVLPTEIPYFKKNGELKSTEKLTAKDLQKYLNLELGPIGFHKPAFVAIKLVSLNTDGTVVLHEDSKLESILRGSTPQLTWTNALSVLCDKIG